jgi:hypothetical protein
MDNKKPSKDFQFFLDNVKELEKKYKGKFIAIKDGNVLGAYDEFAEAVKATLAQGHAAGTFIVQRADSDPASYTATYLNNRFFKVV